MDNRMGSYPSESIAKFVSLILRCCNDKPDKRPSILDVVRELEHILEKMSERGTDFSEPESRSFVESSSTSSFYSSSNVPGSDLSSGGNPISDEFQEYVTSSLSFEFYQGYFQPKADTEHSNIFSRNEVLRIRGIFTTWVFPGTDLFGPSELLNFTFVGPYANTKGILYQHNEANPPIFHHDIKTSNILIESKLTAKVDDFGLSRLAPLLDDYGVGPNYGYLDPEYLLTHKLTHKSDVYSLGVVIFEILTSIKPISHAKDIVREVKLANQAGTMFSIIDNRMGSHPSECIEKFVSLALWCCNGKPDQRP
ncbi:probable LRR receptor-like serine/threonine-protein kinase isoform X2 [Tanacetum coccineum]